MVQKNVTVYGSAQTHVETFYLLKNIHFFVIKGIEAYKSFHKRLLNFEYSIQSCKNKCFYMRKAH